MNYYSKKLTGGAINSAGLSLQDCASIIFLFNNLDNSYFERITFETNDDFTLQFDGHKELLVQVKINQLSTKLATKLLNDYSVPNDKNRAFVVSGFDDEFRNFYSKFSRYKNALNTNSNDSGQITKEFMDECAKKNISFEKITRTQFCVIEKLNSLELAKNSIYDWANRQNLFVDVDRILETLQTKISLKLREDGGNLSKQEIFSIIERCRQSKITSCNDGKEFTVIERYIVEEIETQIHPDDTFYDKLLTLKNEIEKGMYVEAVNRIESLIKYIDLSTTYLWLELMTGKYINIINKSDQLQLDNVYEQYILGVAYFRVNDIDNAIEKFNSVKSHNLLLEANFNLFECYYLKSNINMAKQALNECIDKGLKNEFVYYELGNLYENEDKCLEYYNIALQYNKEFSPVYFAKGKYHRYYNNFEDAIECFEKYLDLSKDYYNTEVLFETAMSYYGVKKNEAFLYLGRWGDQMINFGALQKLDTQQSSIVVDISYHNTNFILLSKTNTGLEIKVNYDVHLRSSGIRSQSGIGVGISPSNSNMLKMTYHMLGVVKDDIQLSKEAAMPILYKKSDNHDDYLAMKEQLLTQTSIELNKDREHYKEFISHNTSVSIYKKLDGLNAIVEIEDYLADILVPKTDEGFQKFRKEIQRKSQFDDAALMIFGPKETLQITFKKDNIKIFDI